MDVLVLEIVDLKL